jgi:hypothetical protein
MLRPNRHSNFYGNMTIEEGFVTVFIDRDRDFEGRLLRHSMTISMAALEEFLKVVCDLPAYEVDGSIARLLKDMHDDRIAEFILLSKHEWIALDEDNQPIPVAVEMPMFNYINQ